ncbi:developmentally regulated protein [Novymonas esmeraldas]|uniref:Developmentally regulated protein n=1 Tax=Novymonas esmeraldas TaxID=1808958 RepID=A0AAW0F282_9TRYP
MTVFRLEQWWKRKDHRGVRGARGARFATLRFHGVFLVSVVALVEYILRSTDDFTARRIVEPPVPAPPPLPRSLSYSTTCEMPHLRSMELERSTSAAVSAPLGSFDAESIRGPSRRASGG